jgi:hypothetical protein
MKLHRRAVVAGLLAAPAAAVAGPQPWTFEAYSAAMKASGRRQVITAEQWRATVARKPRMLSAIQTMLAHHFGKADPWLDGSRRWQAGWEPYDSLDLANGAAALKQASTDYANATVTGPHTITLPGAGPTAAMLAVDSDPGCPLTRSTRHPAEQTP